LILALHRHAPGDPAGGPNTVVDADAGLLWTLGEEAAPGTLLARAVALDPATRWIMRHDRVEFQPGGIAHRHTHPGPGIRCLLYGRITIDSEGEVTTYGPGEPWFEAGPEPVLATTSPTEPSAFTRVLLLPAEWAGRRTIRYVDPADADKPKTQKATILLEQPVAP
jgi:quercetin dioxygenase-like cupin family protein